MSNKDAIAVIEFSLELDHFFNIDLYVGGFYQIRCQLKTAKKVPSKIEVSIPRSSAPQIFPASVVNGKAVGMAFEILYKEEDIVLNDLIEYKAFVPIKMSKLPNVLQFYLSFELWYIDRDEMTRKGSNDVFTAFECVSKRHLTLNFPLFRGLHYRRPVIFDYFHLCAATLTIHGSLVALEKSSVAANVAFAKHQIQASPSTYDRQKSNSTIFGSDTISSASVSSSPRVQNSSSLASSPDLSRRFVAGSANLMTFEEAVFGAITKAGSSSTQRVQNAYQFHRSLCRLLLTAYEALELKLTQLLHCLPSRYQIRIQSVDCAKKFEILQQNVQRLEDESELLAAIDGNVALLSGELTMLWRQFLELFRSREELRNQLVKEHHTARVRRLAEGFFSGSECANLSSLIDFGDVGRLDKMYKRLEEYLRKSSYFQCLPPLGVYCEELDGNVEILPVVFEQRYQPSETTTFSLDDEGDAAFAKNIYSSNKTSSSRIMESDLTAKNLLKGGGLSLDLPHVHRPAIQQQRINMDTNTNGTASSLVQPSRDTTIGSNEKIRLGKRNSNRGIRKPLLPRKSNIWRHRHRLNSFPPAGLESSYYLMDDSMQHLPLVHQVNKFRSTPDLKFNGCPATQRSFGEGTIVSGGDNAEEQLDGMAYQTTNFSMVSDAVGEMTKSDAIDNGHEESFKSDNEPKAFPILNRRTSTLSGEENERQTGVTFDLDSLALENERSLIISPDQMPASADSIPRLTSGIEQELLEFVASKELYKQRMRDAGYDGHLCSDFAAFPSTIPYFLRWKCDDDILSSDLHLIVCVHGLDGTCADLRMVRAYIELCLPDKRIEFLMSKRNQMDTFNDFETMTRNLVDELLLYLSHSATHPTRISFIGHSLGNVIIRSALADPRLEPWLERLYTFLSLNGPHCGILYNNNSVVNMGIWFVQRWKKSISLQQMALKDNPDLRQTFMYQLSLKPCFQYFKYVLLVGSHDDFYVPMHSALVQVCRQAMKDTTSLGQVYTEIVHNIITPLLSEGRTTVVRYSVFHAQQASSTTSHLLGRAAHIAVLDSDLFIEKMLTVSALRYFR